jgi:hypothetical protein
MNNDENLVIELSRAVSNLKAENTDLKQQLSAAEKIPVPRTIIKQIFGMEATLRKLIDDVNYYKRHVTKDIIINRNNKNKPTRRGGIPK